MNVLQKSTLAMALASLFSAGSAYAVMSVATPALVGFKAEYTGHTADTISGKLQLGQTLTIDPSKLAFNDADGDLDDNAARIYEWLIDGVPQGTAGPSMTIPLDNNLVGKPVTLKITPVTVTGEPLVGKEYTLADLGAAGATDGGTGGTINPSTNAPIISNLAMAGQLQVNGTITGTYTWDHNFGDPTDASTYSWQRGVGGTQVAAGNILTSQSVDGYTLVAADAGEVMELTVNAKNGAGITGNSLTIDSTAGGTTDGNPDGTVSVAPAVDPLTVEIHYTSTATVADNGTAGGNHTSGARPVAGVDALTAVMTYVPGTDTNVANYEFTWFAGGVQIGAPIVGDATFTGTLAGPNGGHQGQAITVDVKVKP